MAVALPGFNLNLGEILYPRFRFSFHHLPMNMAILGGIPHLIAHAWLRNCCRDFILSIYRCWPNLPAELQPHNPGYARETQSWQYGKMLGNDFRARQPWTWVESGITWGFGHETEGFTLWLFSIAVANGFSHWKWWFCKVIVSLPEGNHIEPHFNQWILDLIFGWVWNWWIDPKRAMTIGKRMRNLWVA